MSGRGDDRIEEQKFTLNNILVATEFCNPEAVEGAKSDIELLETYHSELIERTKPILQSSVKNHPFFSIETDKNKFDKLPPKVVEEVMDKCWNVCVEESSRTPMKYNEDAIISQIMTYIKETYSKHYAMDNNQQAADVIFDAGHGEGFCLGNALKYILRYGKKEGYNKKDIYKAIHYLVMVLYIKEKEEKK